MNKPNNVISLPATFIDNRFLYMEKGKKEQVKEMFNSIAGTYDALNHFLSLGIDKRWRRKAVDILANDKPKNILDVATGTGDFAIKLHDDLGARITGVDISEGMLEEGRKKLKGTKYESFIDLMLGDSEQLSFPDNNFDAVTVAFGVRNFENLEKGIEEMCRVTKKNGKVVILEFSKPSYFPIKQLYNLYSFHILPFLGGMFSKNKKAYEYLPDSVRKFPDGNDFLNIMNGCGLINCYQKRLSLGIVTIYVGEK